MAVLVDRRVLYSSPVLVPEDANWHKYQGTNFMLLNSSPLHLRPRLII